MITDRRHLHCVLNQAFTDAIEDRQQVALENKHNDPGFSQAATQQATQFKSLRQALLPEPHTTITRAELRALDTLQQGTLMDVLYFASLARKSVIDAHQHVSTSTKEDAKWQHSYLHLLNLLSPSKRTSFVDVPLHQVADMIPEDAWEETDDGGRVYRPSLPKY